MDGGNKRSRLMIMMMVVLMIIRNAEAQITVGIPPCANEIFSCVEYKNSMKPTNACCNPMRDVFETQFACLCDNLFSPAFLERIGFNTTKALRLVRSCSLNLNASICQAALSAPPPSMPLKPKATAGADEGGAGRVAFSGFSFQLLFWCYVLFIY